MFIQCSISLTQKSVVRTLLELVFLLHLLQKYILLICTVITDHNFYIEKLSLWLTRKKSYVVLPIFRRMSSLDLQADSNKIS